MSREEKNQSLKILLPTSKDVREYASKWVNKPKHKVRDTALGRLKVVRHEIELPGLGNKNKRSGTGLITSRNLGEVVKPPERSIGAVKRRINLSFQGPNARSDIEDLRPSGIALPSTEFTSKLSESEKQRKDENKTQQQSKEAAFYYLSSPWNYFDSRMEKYGIGSPSSEIKNQIKNMRSGLPSISDESIALLKSPIKSIRENEEIRLMNSGISETDYQTILAPDISLVDVSALDFIDESIKTESIDSFYDFLSLTLDELFDLEASGTERLMYLANICQYLSLLSHAFLYKFGKYKLDNPVFLEKIISKLEFLTAGEFEHYSKYLQPIFDFISCFEMNNSNVNSYLLEILELNRYKHPLIHELKYQLEPDNRLDNSQPKVGVEVEGIPVVAFGEIPNGFEIGIDGGGTMPEIRRKENSLHFDNTYKKQLYDFWYFAKMTQLKGASLHIHLDDPGGEKLDYFRTLYGSNLDDVKKSSFGTVELRFNLSSYQIDLHLDITTDINSPFFHNQYDISSFIEALISYGETKDITPDMLSSVPKYWQLKLKVNDLLSYDNFMQKYKKSGWNWDVAYEGIKKLKDGLSFEQFNDVIKASGFRPKITILALEKLNTTLFLDQVSWLSSISSGNTAIASKAIEKLDNILSLDDLVRIIEQYHVNEEVNNAAFEKLSENLSFNQAKYLLKKFNYDYYLTKEVFKKLDKKISFDELKELQPENQADSSVVSLGVYSLEETLSIDQLDWILEYSNTIALAQAISKLKDNLSLDQALNIFNKFGARTLICKEVVNKLDRMLSLEEAIEVSMKYYRYNGVALYIFDKVENIESGDKIIEIYEKTNNKQAVFKALEKFEGTLSFEQAFEILTKSFWDIYLLVPVLNKVLLTSEDLPKFLESLKLIHSDYKLYMWSMLLRFNLSKPIVFKEEIFNAL